MHSVPPALQASHQKFFGAAGRDWIDRLPALTEAFVDRWELTPDGPTCSGAVAWVLPVLRADGTPAALKLQPVDDETCGEPDALRTWGGHGAVRLLAADDDAGAMLLERLDPHRSLQTHDDDRAALTILSELLARLSAVAAPPGIRTLEQVARDMLDRAPGAAGRVSGQRADVLRSCAAAVAEVLPDSGDRLLHWDLHFGNVLAPIDDRQREPWLAIDPKPLAGDPGFELLAALHNRWEDVVATGDVGRAVRRRYDPMTEIVQVDRDRARCWTLGRILQNMLWSIEADNAGPQDEPDRVIAEILLADGAGR